MRTSFNDVNFIPDEVVTNRKRDSQVKSLNRLAVTAMVLSLIAGFGLLGYNIYTRSKVTALEGQIDSEEVKIQELKEFAEKGYKLGLRLSSIEKILNERPYYGKVVEQLYREIPDGVGIKNLSISEKGAVTLTGTSYPNYIPIAVFQDNLKNSDPAYFLDIRLRSASLDKTTGNITFTLEFLINLPATYEPIRKS
jgi:Tfp pilus assembly protein PilN